MSKTYPQYPDTSYPDSFQNLTTYKDITQDDLIIYNQYINYVSQGNFNAAQTVLQGMTDYDKKLLTAEKFNQMTDTIYSLQTMYTDEEWTALVLEKQQEWLNIINQFSYVGLWNIIGTWSSTKSYAVGDIVYYSSKVWKCLLANTNKTPSASSTYWTQTYKKNTMVGYSATAQSADPNFYLYIATTDITTNANPYNNYNTGVSSGATPQWFRLTIRGLRGEAGKGMNFMFDWDDSIMYDPDTIVVYNNQWWSCVEANQNQPPSAESPYWTLELGVGTATIPIQATAPPVGQQQVGDLWFQLVTDGGGLD